jgi:hypothetical protein
MISYGYKSKGVPPLGEVKYGPMEKRQRLIGVKTKEK